VEKLNTVIATNNATKEEDLEEHLERFVLSINLLQLISLIFH